MLKVNRGWGLDVERGPDWLLVRVQPPRRAGRGTPSLAEVLWSLLEQHLTYRLVLELDQVDVLDGELLDQLAAVHDRVMAHGGLMRLCGLSPENRRILFDHRLDDRFVAYEDREEAVLGDSLPRHPR